MKKIASCLALILLSLQSSIEAGYQIEEKFSMPLPQIFTQWKLGYQKTTKGSYTRRFILTHETMERWSQLINIQFKDKSLIKSSTALAAFQDEKAHNKKILFKVYSEQENDVVFEKIFPTGLHEIVRMVMTERGLHRIAYVNKASFSQIDRTHWIERLSSGVVIEN